MLITRLFVFLEVCNVTPTYRKSWAKNLLMWSDFTLGSSFKVKRWLIGFGEFLSGGYNLYRFSDVLGLVSLWKKTTSALNRANGKLWMKIFAFSQFVVATIYRTVVWLSFLCNNGGRRFRPSTRVFWLQFCSIWSAYSSVFTALHSTWMDDCSILPYVPYVPQGTHFCI